MLPKRHPGVTSAQRKSDRGRDQQKDTLTNKSKSVSANRCGRRTNNLTNSGKRTSLVTNRDAPPTKRTKQKQANTDTSLQSSVTEGYISRIAEVFEKCQQDKVLLVIR